MTDWEDQMGTFKLQLFYDGLCRLCSAEIEQYRKTPGSNQIEFIDITQAAFQAESFSLDPGAVHRHIHVRTENGSVFTGVEAFFEIWKLLPKYRFLQKTLDRPLLLPILKKGYDAFARIRPYLPRKQSSNPGADCSASPYCKINLKSL